MFADRNFATGLVFMAVTGVLLLAGLALLPPLLQNLYGYSVLQSGFLTAPRGVGTLISMLRRRPPWSARSTARLLVGIGVALMGVSLWMMTGFALDQPSRPVIVSGVVQGLGLGLIFVPLQSLAFETLAPRMRTTAAALLNLSRNIGGSVGISVVSAQLVRMTQVAHADIASQSPRRPSRRRTRPCCRPSRRPGTGCARDPQRRGHPAGGVHRLSRRLQADDDRHPRGAAAAAADEARQEGRHRRRQQHVAMD